MKTKLYTLFTGLLMAACITSYGQEIVNHFRLNKTGMDLTGCDIQENKDGTLLIGTIANPIQNYYSFEYVVFKTSADGELLDSLSITSLIGMNITDFGIDDRYLIRNPRLSDAYIFTDRSWDEANNTYYFRMVFIDANLGLHNDISVPIAHPTQGSIFKWDKWIFDTQDFIVSFWIDDVFHIMRIGLDGTIKNDLETTELFPPQFDYEYHPDTLLWYSGFGIYDNNPLTYYKLGGYHNEIETYPVYCYFFDEDFNIIGTHWYEKYSDNIIFNGSNLEHIVPFDENSYLMVSEMEYPDESAGIALIKYDTNHNPICISPEFGTFSYPLQTEISNNAIYQFYVNLDAYYHWTVSLACLDDNLNLIWDSELHGGQYNGLYGNSIVSKPNGDLIVGFGSFNNNNSEIHVYTVRNTTSNTSEKTNCDSPFSLYPNPVKDQLSLRFNDGTEPESVDLYDLAGRLAGTKTNGLESIDMSAMPSGVYMLHVTMKDGTSYYKKAMKE